jgi:hypothetical protein
MHVPYIDVLNEFIAEAPAARLYRPNDAHWNVRGNRLAAQIVARELAVIDPAFLDRSRDSAVPLP